MTEQAATKRLAVAALGAGPIEAVLAEGARLVAELLDVEYCDVLELLPGGRYVRGWACWQAGEGNVPSPAGSEACLPLAPSSLLSAALRTGGVLRHADLAVDPRDPCAAPLLEAGFVGGLTLALHGQEGPLGLLRACTRTPRAFSEVAVASVESIADILGATVCRHRAKAELRWRAQLDAILIEVSTGFIADQGGAIDAGVQRVLSRVGEFLGADRGSVFLLRPDGLIDQTHEWCGPGVVPGMPGMQGLDPDVAPWLTGRLGRGEVCVDDVQDLPAEAAREAALLRERGVRALIALPLQAGGRLIGYGSFHVGARAHLWPADLATVLRPLGDMLAGAIAGRRIAVELATSEARYRSLVDDMRDIIVRVGADGTIEFVNRAWSEFTGIPADEVVGMGPFDNVHPDDRLLAAEHLQAVAMGAGSQSCEIRFLTTDGQVRWMEVKGTALRDEEGNVAGFSGMVCDVTERHEAEERVATALAEAERARDEAERASFAKSEFLSRTSHELRTPLNAILGFAQLLELGELAPEDAESVEHIRRAGRHLLELINEVLDISRIETGGLALSLEPISVAEVVTESLDLVRPMAALRGLVLLVPARTSEASVVADKQRLKQVLVNLLSNAVKYNRDGGRLAVSCTSLPHRAGTDADSAGPDWVRIAVTDTGPGIPADRLADAFLPFERIGAEHSDVEGSGVGLALTKSLVEALGGRIAVTSTVGEGSTFSVDLPSAGPTQLPGQRSTALSESYGWIGATDVPAEPAPGPLVVYVEDNLSNVTLVRRVLDRRPHVRLVVVGDGDTALETVRTLGPDLVLLDLHLPGRSGEEVLAAMQRDAGTADVPVVVVTADVTPGMESRLRERGAAAFISKPLDVVRLLAEVDRYAPLPAETRTRGE